MKQRFTGGVERKFPLGVCAMTYMLMSGIKKEDSLTPINFDKWVGEWGNPEVAIENIKKFNKAHGTDISALVYFYVGGESMYQSRTDERIPFVNVQGGKGWWYMFNDGQMHYGYKLKNFSSKNVFVVNKYTKAETKLSLNQTFEWGWYLYAKPVADESKFSLYVE